MKVKGIGEVKQIINLIKFCYKSKSRQAVKGYLNVLLWKIHTEHSVLEFGSLETMKCYVGLPF